MLFQFGEVTFEVAPFNVHEHGRDTGADFAVKDVIGTMRPLESTGEGDDVRNMSGRLFPAKFGGLGTLEQLHSMRTKGMAHILVRGDGAKLGWFVLTHIRERDTFLAADGVGNMIEFDMTIVRTPIKPTATSYVSTLLRLFI